MTVSLPQEKVQQILKEIQNLLQVQSKIRYVARHRLSCFNLSCSLPRPPPLSLFGKRQDRVFVSCPILPRENENISRIANRASMVASELGSTQWKTHTFSRSDHNYNNRCFKKKGWGEK